MLAAKEGSKRTAPVSYILAAQVTLNKQKTRGAPMTDTRPSRRKFIVRAIAASSVMIVPHKWLMAKSATTPTASDLDQTLVARRLFPHDGLADDVYAEVAESVFDSFGANPESADLLDLAEAALNAQVNGDWIDVDEDRQVAALKGIENEAFFGAIVAGLRGAFYNHPKVWAQINYPGSSREHGGYKDRGFDDIDWLPEV